MAGFLRSTRGSQESQIHREGDSAEEPGSLEKPEKVGTFFVLRASLEPGERGGTRLRQRLDFDPVRSISDV